MSDQFDMGYEAIVYHPSLSNIYGCEIGDFSTVGPFVEIQRGVKIGKFSKISSHSFLCSGVTIGNHVFVGHGVMFTNDLYPVILGPFEQLNTLVEDDVSIGSGSTILPVIIHRGAIVGAGSVVVKDVPPYAIVAGNPARVVREFLSLDERRKFLNGLRPDTRRFALSGEIQEPVFGAPT